MAPLTAAFHTWCENRSQSSDMFLGSQETWRRIHHNFTIKNTPSRYPLFSPENARPKKIISAANACAKKSQKQ
jgi:hypothetical protein